MFHILKTSFHIPYSYSIFQIQLLANTLLHCVQDIRLLPLTSPHNLGSMQPTIISSDNSSLRHTNRSFPTNQNSPQCFIHLSTGALCASAVTTINCSAPFLFIRKHFCISTSPGDPYHTQPNLTFRCHSASASSL